MVYPSFHVQNVVLESNKNICIPVCVCPLSSGNGDIIVSKYDHTATFEMINCLKLINRFGMIYSKDKQILRIPVSAFPQKDIIDEHFQLSEW